MSTVYMFYLGLVLAAFLGFAVVARLLFAR
jgi:hypothetical protein